MRGEEERAMRYLKMRGEEETRRRGEGNDTRAKGMSVEGERSLLCCAVIVYAVYVLTLENST